MTIAVAVKTATAVVFGADSKLTTTGVAGINPDGTPNLVEQTYDNATKVAHDRNRYLMVMGAGQATIGDVAATDFVARVPFSLYPDANSQDAGIASIVDQMVNRKSHYWSQFKITPDQWLGPTLLLASPGPQEGAPRVWRVDLNGAGAQKQEILQNGGVWLEGAYWETYSLLYGYHPGVLVKIAEQLKVDSDQMAQTATQPQGWLRPIDKINYWSMPPQDAVDLTYFLATVQIQMDRFLPGPPRCGGPVDVMVMETSPYPAIHFMPGKELHHP
jgi:hypothetical protein